MLKQVSVVRADLKMRRGKESAQVGHSFMKVFFDRAYKIGNEGFRHMVIPLTEEMDAWSSGQFTKISVSCNSEEELMELYEKAKKYDLPCALVEDAGKTEFHGVKTATCIAIGPAKAETIDLITGHLKLR